MPLWGVDCTPWDLGGPTDPRQGLTAYTRDERKGMQQASNSEIIVIEKPLWREEKE